MTRSAQGAESCTHAHAPLMYAHAHNICTHTHICISLYIHHNITCAKEEIKKRKLAWVGHVTRYNILSKTILQDAL